MSGASINKRITACLLLLALVCTRAVTPVGFMPNSLASGQPFSLCPSDFGSAQLLANLPHAHHHHQATHTAGFEKACEFSVLGFAATINVADWLALPIVGLAIVSVLPNNPLQKTNRHFRPAVRAPPQIV